MQNSNVVVCKSHSPAVAGEGYFTEGRQYSIIWRSPVHRMCIAVNDDNGDERIVFCPDSSHGIFLIVDK